MVDILSDLEARGLIQDTIDRAALAARLAEGPMTLYCGFGPMSIGSDVNALNEAEPTLFASGFAAMSL